MKKILLILGMVLVLGLVGCSESKTDFKVGMALTGPSTDGGFNESAFKGLKMVEKDLGAEIVYNENTQPADYEKILREYAKQGCNVIIGHGYQFSDAGKVVAEEYPDVKIIITSALVNNGKNLASVLLDNKEQGFLQGAFAALMNEGNTVGVIGGQDIPPIKNMVIGFTAGAKNVNPDIKVLSAFTGDFDDASKVKEQALSMMSQGADVIGVSANNAGRGLFDAAREKNKFAIASIYVNFDEYKDSVIALGRADMAIAIFQVVEDAKAGKLEGKNYIKGIKDKVVDLVYNPALEDKVPAATKEKIEELKAGVINGSITIE